MARSLKKIKTEKNKLTGYCKVPGINESSRNKHGFVLPEFVYRFVPPEKIKDIVFDTGVRIKHRCD
jgi:hypothetical protein